MMEPNYDVILDCLPSLISKAPLKERLFTLRQVNSQWKTVVEKLCAKERKLTLEIGSGIKWKKTFEDIKCEKLLINAVSHFHTLTVGRLTDELTTFLTSTFPRLESLAVVVDESKMNLEKDILHCLPQLISAYSSTLTTLQLVLYANENTVEAALSPLITSIDGLHHLKRLSLVDLSDCMQGLQPFDLPHLLSTSLDTMDFYSIESSTDFAPHWVNSLRARNRNKSTSLMKINFFVGGFTRFPVSLPADVAAHFYFVVAYLHTAADLEQLVSSFTNLRGLRVMVRPDLSVGDVLVQVSRLPHLTQLEMLSRNLEKIDYSANHPLPVLPAVRRLYLEFIYRTPLHDQVKAEVLRLSEVFPNVQQVLLDSYTAGCDSCGWKIEVFVNEAGGYEAHMVRGSEQQMEQCVTRLASPFGSDKAKPKVDVSFRIRPWMSYIISIDENGQVKRTIKPSANAEEVQKNQKELLSYLSQFNVKFLSLDE